MAQVLDSLPQLHALVLADLVSPGTRTDFGRTGQSAQQVLRILVLQLLLKADFEQLEFHLCDSPSYRSFCLLGIGEPGPKRSTLHENISRLRAQTLQGVHQALVQFAVEQGIESGKVVRTDTTPVAAAMRAPSDALLLGDAVRVLLRLLKRAHKWVPTTLPNRSRRARRRVVGIFNAKSDEERKRLYRDLMQQCMPYVEEALFCAQWLEGVADAKAQLLSIELRGRAEATLRILDQTQRRVFEGEAVPAADKTVSLFETHADILTKRKQVVYGHKVCLTFGKSGVVLGADILLGNAADAKQAVPSMQKVAKNTGRMPDKAAMDLGFASKGNAEQLKELGIRKIGFSKGRGLSSEQLCGSVAEHRKLRRFRAGVEGLISWLKRSLGMGQSRWKGEAGFMAYVWGVIVVASVQAIARAG